MSDVNNGKLKGWMTSHGVTYQQLADVLGMKRSLLVTRMDGRIEWRYSEIQTILNFTGLSYEELF